MLQISKNDASFDTGIELFIKKCEGIVREFICYFKAEWRQQNKFWFKGACHTVPRANTSLEAFNRMNTL